MTSNNHLCVTLVTGVHHIYKKIIDLNRGFISLAFLDITKLSRFSRWPIKRSDFLNLHDVARLWSCLIKGVADLKFITDSYSRTRQITFCRSAVKIGELEKDPLIHNRMAKNGVKQNQKEEFSREKRNLEDFAKIRNVRYSLLRRT